MAMLGDRLTVVRLKFRPYPKQSDQQSEGSSAAQSPLGSPRSRSLERSVTLNPLAWLNQGRCSAGTAAMQGRLLAVGKCVWGR